jgi:sodium/potassium-transporting ATPase subunit alpha
MIDWLYTQHAEIDLRMAALDCILVNGKPVYSQSLEFGPCKVQQISPYTNKPACYTTEGIKYAQSAYFYGTVICQFFNAFCCKTRKVSVFNQGLNNTFMLFALNT